MNTKYYIAYGSNLNKAQMKRRCPTAMPFATATLENYELLFRGKRDCAVATIESKSGGKVPVAIWEITDMDEKSLDRYEGYPYLYRKEELEVKIDNEKIKAMVYIMNEGRPIGTPSCYYYSTIRQGYKDFFLDYNFLKNAVNKEYKHDR